MAELTPDPRGATQSATTSASLRGRMGNVAAASAIALVIGQVVSMAQTVALARLLTPTEVGYFAAGSVVTSFITTFVEGGLRAGLVHREDRLADAAETIFRATLVIGFVMSLLALASAPLIGLLFSSETAGLVAASMAGGILLFSLTNVPESLLQRQFSVRRRLIVGPAVAFTFAVVSVSLAAAGLGVWSLVIGTYASSTVWVLTLWWICDWRPGRGRFDMGLYRELVRYGLPLAMGTVADQVTGGVQAVVAGRFLSIQSLGLFRYGERIAKIPVSIIVDVGSTSLFPAYSRIAKEPERFRRTFLHAMSLVVVAGAGLSGLLVALGEPLVVVVLGEDWRGAGVVLVAMAGISLGTAMYTSVEAIKGAGRTSLLYWMTMFETVLSIGLVIVMAYFWGLFGVGLSISTASLIMGVVVLAMAKPIVRVSWQQLLRAIVPQVLAAGVAAAAAGALEKLVLNSADRPVWMGLLTLALGSLIYTVTFAVALRLVAPTSFRHSQDVMVSAARVVRRRMSSARRGGSSDS